MIETRHGRIAIGLLAGSLAIMPAQAGIRARYKVAEEAKLIEATVADNGDVSFTRAGDTDRVAVIGGKTFVVIDSGQGFEVYRNADAIAALRKTGVPTLPKDVADELAAIRTDARTPFRATPIGRKTIAGTDGTVFRVDGLGDRDNGGSVTLVAAGDPALRPLGAAIGQVLAEAAEMFTLIDEARLSGISSYLGRLAEVAALGTPMEMADAYELRSVTFERIPPETIALPGAPVSPDALIARVRALSPGG